MIEHVCGRYIQQHDTAIYRITLIS